MIRPLLFLAGLALTGACVPMTAAESTDSPFVPSGWGQDPAAAPPPPSRLATLEFAGVSVMAGETRVYLADPAPGGRSRWLVVGIPDEGLTVTQYDSAHATVHVQAAGEERWLTLRGSRVEALPVARRSDGTVDWTYMKLSQKGRETEALHLMQDIMFAGMSARGQAASTVAATAESPSAPAKTKNSPVR